MYDKRICNVRCKNIKWKVADELSLLVNIIQRIYIQRQGAAARNIDGGGAKTLF